ncbi:uncharacterized protein LOC143283894 [Babylonia areolata]|uniref:uncharacterized protein LOC143283894 n=1 Tax=Babylonia areolata TaxID=304850 RepID=UPI003FD3BE5E
MGQGQPWLRGTVLSKFWLLAVLLLTVAHSTARSWPLSQDAPPCPTACQCSWSPLNGTSTHMAATCGQAGLTKLPANLPSNLLSLDLGGNHLTSQLTGLPLLGQLQLLDLSNNSLTLLHTGLFTNMTKLTTLSLCGNRIEVLEDRVFESLHAVHVLNLAFNKLRSLNNSVLFGLDSVQVLNLTNNLIGQVSNQTFLYLHRLKVLDLSHNRLQYLPTDAFLGLTSVHTILLCNNYLTDIMGAFHGLQQLSALDLSYNRLDALENDTFADLQQLSSLQLSFNNISNISPTVFTFSAVLKRLDLQGNSLEQLQGGLFDNLSSLQHLDLSQMPYLQWISCDALESVVSLRFLNVSHNPQLSFLPPQLLAHLPQLSVLDLRSNNLSLLSHLTFHTNPRLSHLYLAHNPFLCGCGMAWMLPQPHSANLSVLTDRDSVLCQLPSNGTAVPISQVSQEIIRCNNVTSINATDTVFAKIGSQLVLRCDYSADESSVLTWTTPRGRVFHYHPYHPQGTWHLLQVSSANSQMEESPPQHWWRSQTSYDADIQYSPDHMVLQQDGSLFIDFVLRSDAGPYQCSVHNSQHKASVTTTLLLDYTILFDVKIMSIVVGLACAASFLTLNTVYVIIMWGARKLVNKRRRQRIHKLLESLDEYRTTQIARIRSNYSVQLGRIRDHYHTQSMRLKDNYNTQMKRVRRGCSNQVERIRDNYHTRLTHLKQYSSHQIQQIREATNHQIIRIRDYGSLQMERLRETYKLQQQHVLKVIEAMNLENCRTVVETECMRTESMIFDINFPELDDDTTSTEEASSQHSQPDSVYATALNSEGSSQESLATVVEGQESEGYPVTETTIVVLPSDPIDAGGSLHNSSNSSSLSALYDEEMDASHMNSGDDNEKETVM